MKITVRQLRQLIREGLLETTIDSRIDINRFPAVGGDSHLTTADREQLGRNSIKDMDDGEELPPHLRNANQPYDPDEFVGPVPPTDEGDPYAVMDPYVDGWSIIPTPNVLGK